MSSKRPLQNFQNKKNSSLEGFLLSVLRWGIYLTLTTPLIYTSLTIFPFILGKTLLLRTLVELMAPFFVVLLLVAPHRRPKSSALLISVGVYLAVLLAAAIFGVDFRRSFWSNHERMTGYFTLLHVALLGLMAASVFKTVEDWRRLFRASLLVSLVVGALGFWQHFFGDNFLYFQAGGRTASTLGNPIYLGTYALFHIFLALDGFVAPPAGGGGWWRPFYLLGLVTNVPMLYFAYSKGATVALIAGLAFLVISAVLFGRSARLKAAAGTIFAAAIILFIIVRATPEALWIKRVPFLNLAAQVSLGTTTAKTRFLNWQTAWQAWKARPILGWGPENYYHAFNLNFDPKFYDYSSYETWQDHAHNIIFDVLNESGVLGLLSYLSILALSALFLVRACRRGILGKANGFIFGAALLSYFVQNQFVFDTMTSWLIFYLLLAFVHALQNPPAEEAHVDDKETNHALLAPGLAAALILIYFANLSSFIVSAMSIKAGKLVNTNPRGALSMFDRALAMPSPYKAESRDEYAKIAMFTARSAADMTKEEGLTLFEKVNSELKKNVTEHPGDTYFRMNYAEWLMTTGVFFGPTFYDEAERQLNQARVLSPRRQQVWYQLARLEALSGKSDLAVETASAAVKLNPSVSESYWHLGEALVSARRFEEARQEFINSRGRLSQYVPRSNFEAAAALAALRTTKDKKSLEWFLELLAAGNFSKSLYADVALAFFELGDNSRAKELAQRIVAADASQKERLQAVLSHAP